METRRLAAAPGKVVLAGEYAVLDGAPAISMAVRRTARVGIDDVDDDACRVEAPGHTDVTGRFRLRDGRIRWLSGEDEFRLVDAVFRASGRRPIGNCSITLDSGEFFDTATGTKIGLGSSAAMTVALCAAIHDSADVAPIARRAHRRFQGGVGSGVDVATSLHGGLIEYRTDGARAVAIDWPAGLRFRLIWSGIAASTRDRLSRLGAGTDANRPSRVRLSAAARRMARAWRSGDAGSIIEAYRAYIDDLHSFSVDHDLGIFDAGHEELCAAAAAENLVYKPCGAGGGDIGIVFASDDAALDAFVGTLPAGQSHIDCGMDYDGVRTEEPE